MIGVSVTSLCTVTCLFYTGLIEKCLPSIAPFHSKSVHSKTVIPRATVCGRTTDAKDSFPNIARQIRSVKGPEDGSRCGAGVSVALPPVTYPHLPARLCTGPPFTAMRTVPSEPLPFLHRTSCPCRPPVSPEQQWTAAEIPGKGRGLVATTFISKGARKLSERLIVRLSCQYQGRSIASKPAGDGLASLVDEHLCGFGGVASSGRTHSQVPSY